MYSNIVYHNKKELFLNSELAIKIISLMANLIKDAHSQ